MRVDIKVLKIKNFLSIGNGGMTIDFRNGLYRVNGENLDTGTKNGVGKSSAFCDALLFALFGKPLRKINLPDLPNTINGKKGLETEIHFTINSNSYIIERGIKPNYLKLTINGKVQDEDSAKKFTQKNIDAIIGSDYNTFTHMLVISNTYSKSFLDLTPAEKRVILEDILGVSIFGKMGDIAKDKFTDNKNDFTLAKREYDIIFAAYEEMKNNIKKLLEKSQVFEEQKKKNVSEIEEQIATINAEIDKCKENIINESELTKKVEALTEHKERLEKKTKNIEVTIRMNEENIKKHKKLLDKLNESPVCAICGTDISSEHVQKHMNELKDEITTLMEDTGNVSKESKDINEQLKKIYEKIKDLERNISQSIKNNDRVKNLSERLDDFTKKLEKANNEVNNFKEMIDKDGLKKKKDMTNELQLKLEEITKEKNYLEFIKKLLSEDGVKSYIIKNLLNFWNMKVNDYLKKLNADFSIKFDETLDAVIKSRNRDELQYHSFSGGEKARIDVAILMSVLDLSKLQNSIDMNVMVVDELIDNAIDAVGREDVLHLFKQKTRNENKSIYVISHADNLPVHLFDKEINLVKKGGFTSFA